MSRRDANTTKVFVGSLPEGVTTDDLRELFAPYGKIVECDIGNRCGFLHLEDKELALKSIEELNNTTLKDGTITVEKGRVKAPRRIRENSGVRQKRDRPGPYVRNNVNLRGPGGPQDGFNDRRYDNSGYGDRGYGDRGYEEAAYGAREYGGYDERGAYLDRGYGARADDPYTRDRYGDFDRSQPPRGYPGGYDNIGDRRMRGYSNEPRGYSGYDRGAYDERRIPPGGAYESARPLASERRSLIAPSNNMFSRRSDIMLKTGPSPPPLSGGYGDRNSYPSSGYGGGNAYNSGANYDSQGDSGYGNSSGGYNSASNGPAYGASGYGSSVGGNAYNSGPVGASNYNAVPVGGGSYGSGGGYNTSASVGGGGYSTSGPVGGNGYGSSASGVGNTYGGGYNTTADGYDSSYNSRPGGNYDAAYSQQKGFASSGGGSGPRSAGAGRRY